MINSQIKNLSPYIFAILLTLVIATLYIWFSNPAENTLPEVYGVM